MVLMEMIVLYCVYIHLTDNAFDVATMTYLDYWLETIK